MPDPVIKTIEVPCSQANAFSIFIDKVGSWWPRDKNSVSAMQGEVAKKVEIEAKTGGSIHEIGHDDTRHEWGSSPPTARQISWYWHGTSVCQLNRPAELQ